MSPIAKFLSVICLALHVGVVCVSETRAAGPDERLTVGLKAYQDRFYSLAAKELRAFLEAAPEDPRRDRVLAVLSQAEIGQENWDGARWALERLQSAGGEAAGEALYWLVWVSSRQGDAASAVTYADQYVRRGGAGKLAEVLDLAAVSAWKSGRFKDAARLNEQFLAKVPADPRRPRVWVARVSALERAGEPADRVLQVVNAALKEGLTDDSLRAAVAEAGVRAARTVNAPRREAELWRVLGDASSDPEVARRARFATGLASREAGDSERAVTALEAFLKQYRAGADAASAHVALAELLRSRKDWGGTLRHLDAVLALSAADRRGLEEAELHKGALAAALAAGNERAAVRHATILLEQNTALAARELGTIHMLLGRHAAARDADAAIRHFLAVPEPAPPHREARLAAARLLVDSGRSKEALAVLQPRLDGPAPTPEEQLVALAAAEGAEVWTRAALLADALAAAPPPGTERGEFARRAALYWLRAGDAEGYERALHGLAQGGGDPPTARWAAEELQRLTFERGEWEASVSWATLASAGRPPDGVVGLRHAEALEHLGQDEAALQVLASVAAGRGGQVGAAWARSGAIHDRGGRWPEAQSAYTKALEVGVPDTAAAWIRERLNQKPGTVDPSDAGTAPEPKSPPPEEKVR